MAANFLQTLQWQTQKDLLKSIITFYTKARAFDQLAEFYEICAHYETSHGHNYPKAMSALLEALKQTDKMDSLVSTSVEQLSVRKQRLQWKIDQINRYLKIHDQNPNSNALEMLEGCMDLLRQYQQKKEQDESSTTESIVCIPDLYALMVDVYYTKGQV